MKKILKINESVELLYWLPIPEEVLKEVQEELLEWNDAKSSVMELVIAQIFQEVASESKKILLNSKYSENYDVYFCKVRQHNNLR